MTARTGLAVALAVALLAAPSAAGAQQAQQAPEAQQAPPSQQAPESPPPSQQENPRRDPAFYRGRTNGTSAGEVLLWVPRVLFSPLYLATEYAIRVPVRAALAATDRLVPFHTPQSPPGAESYFQWTPTFVADAGLLTSVGGAVRWDNALVRGHRMSLTTATGAPSFSLAGLEFFHVRGEDRWNVGPVRLGARGGFLTRPDREFYGTGPRADSAGRTQFRLTRREVFAFAGLAPGAHAEFELSAGYRSEDSAPGIAPSIESVYPLQDMPGFGSLGLFLTTASARVDTRGAAVASPNGIYVESSVAFAQDVRTPGRRFLVAEVEAEASLEVMRPGRVLSLSAYGADAATLGDEPVPFTHLPTLGGARHQGFRYGRYRDHSALALELNYRYPVWFALDALLFASVGGVFGTHFAGFAPGLLTASFGTGLRVGHRRGRGMEFVAALGTRRFEEGFGVDGLRLYFTLNSGP